MKFFVLQGFHPSVCLQSVLCLLKLPAHLRCVGVQFNFALQFYMNLWQRLDKQFTLLYFLCLDQVSFEFSPPKTWNSILSPVVLVVFWFCVIELFPFVHQKPLKQSKNHLCDKLVFVVFWFQSGFRPITNDVDESRGLLEFGIAV